MKEQDGLHLSDFKSQLEDTSNFKGVEINYAARGRRSCDVDGRAKFESIRGKLLDELVKNLRERFPNVALFDAMEVRQEFSSHYIFWCFVLLEYIYLSIMSCYIFHTDISAICLS